MIPRARAALLAFAAIVALESDAAANAVLVAYEEDGDVMSITHYGTVDAVLHRPHRLPCTCHYALDAKAHASLKAALQEPAVQSALHAHAVLDGRASRVVARGDAIEFKPNAPAAAYAVRLLRLELEVELLKARVRYAACPTSP